MQLELDQILGLDTEKEIFSIEAKMLKLIKPSIWNIYIEDNVEVQIDKDFEKMILSLSEHTNDKVDEYSAYKFFSFIELLNEKAEKNGEINN